jgi:hypothetical protein
VLVPVKLVVVFEDVMASLEPLAARPGRIVSGQAIVVPDARAGTSMSLLLNRLDVMRIAHS